MGPRLANDAECQTVKAGVAPRLAAAKVVGRVLRDGAWTRPAVAGEGESLSSIDRSMLDALAFGTIRRAQSIDRAIAAHTDRPIEALDSLVLDQLRVGLFELWYGRQPPSAVVDCAVEAIRVQRSQAGGFVNAVLRKLSGKVPPEDRESRLALPGWLLEVLDSGWGSAETDAFALASLEAAPVAVRARPHLPPPRNGEAVAGIPGSFLVPPGATHGHPLADPSSVAVVVALDVQAGMRVADLAAAPGGKTMDIVDRLAGDGFVAAVDRHRRRALKAARRVREAHWIIGDGSCPPLPLGSFDRVLIDAPCSGLGTLRRRPEIRHRVTPAEIERLARLQRGILEAGLELLVPGGLLVYSVCTVTTAETTEQVAGLNPQPLSLASNLPGRPYGDGWLLAPHLSGTDGMFIAMFGRD